MGTVIRFAPRDESASEKTARLLARIGDAYQQRIRAAAVLPALLAQLAREGDQELALEALCAWGEGTMEAHEVLKMVQAKAEAD